MARTRGAQTRRGHAAQRGVPRPTEASAVSYDDACPYLYDETGFFPAEAAACAAIPRGRASRGRGARPVLVEGDEVILTRAGLKKLAGRLTGGGTTGFAQITNYRGSNDLEIRFKGTRTKWARLSPVWVKLADVKAKHLEATTQRLRTTEARARLGTVTGESPMLLPPSSRTDGCVAWWGGSTVRLAPLRLMMESLRLLRRRSMILTTPQCRTHRLTASRCR